MNELTTTTGIVALAAVALALVALLWAALLTRRLSRVRGAQRAVLGDSERDLVEHAAALQHAFAALEGMVGESERELRERVDAVELALRDAVVYRALVRYDAYGEMSGRQSTSVALLDNRRSGVVLSSITHRETARLYAKQVNDGHGEVELSPEEAEAVRLALTSGHAERAVAG